MFKPVEYIMPKESKLLQPVGKGFLTAQFILDKLAFLGSLVSQAERTVSVLSTPNLIWVMPAEGVVLELRLPPREGGFLVPKQVGPGHERGP